MTDSPLRRSRDTRVLAGVCAGLAVHLGLPVAWVRIAMAAFVLLGGAGALFYLWLWIFVPWESSIEVPAPRTALTRPAPEIATAAEPETDRRHLPIPELLLGAALLVAGVGFGLSQLGVGLPFDVLLPAMVVLIGVGLTWWQIADRDRPERQPLPRVLGALALVAVGVLMFFVTAQQPSVVTVISAAVAVLAGVALALAPWLLRLNRELLAERAARAREAERAEIAAHLHDSVLQTLALIQQRSEPGSEVSRLARGQERELREWLFRGVDSSAAGTRAVSEAAEAELRAHAAALEAEFPVRFEIVAVGDRTAVPEPIVAAAREAMLNAARHAGGDITVFFEAGPAEIRIDVTDRGPGLDPGNLPDGRMGVRESILGRMERAGGSARIMPGPGGAGTAVRLAIPRDAALDGGHDAGQHAAGDGRSDGLNSGLGDAVGDGSTAQPEEERR